MGDYRIYWLDVNNHIVRAENLTAATDAEAQGVAEVQGAAEVQLWAAGAIEVWRGTARIARIEKPQKVRLLDNLGSGI